MSRVSLRDDARGRRRRDDGARCARPWTGCSRRSPTGPASSAAEILELAIVGNPIMHHLLLGIDPTPLGSAPFALATDRRRPHQAPPRARAVARIRARGSTSCRASPATSARTRPGSSSPRSPHQADRVTPRRRRRHERRDRPRRQATDCSPHRPRPARPSRAPRSAPGSAPRPAPSSASGSTATPSSRASGSSASSLVRRAGLRRGRQRGRDRRHRYLRLRASSRSSPSCTSPGSSPPTG